MLGWYYMWHNCTYLFNKLLIDPSAIYKTLDHLIIQSLILPIVSALIIEHLFSTEPWQSWELTHSKDVHYSRKG